MKTCPICRQQNPSANSFCGNCGADLVETNRKDNALLVRRPTPVEIAETQLATPQAKALVVTVAVGVATLLAEAGLSYLQRRLSDMERPSLSLRRGKKAVDEKSVIIPPNASRPPDRVITVVSERVIEEKRWGRPARRIVERMVWRGEERRS
jgi:hypothetical protein